jgi:hypothetical protein
MEMAKTIISRYPPQVSPIASLLPTVNSSARLGLSLSLVEHQAQSCILFGSTVQTRCYTTRPWAGTTAKQQLLFYICHERGGETARNPTYESLWSRLILHNVQPRTSEFGYSFILVYLVKKLEFTAHLCFHHPGRQEFRTNMHDDTLHARWMWKYYHSRYHQTGTRHLTYGGDHPRWQVYSDRGRMPRSMQQRTNGTDQRWILRES